MLDFIVAQLVATHTGKISMSKEGRVTIISECSNAFPFKYICDSCGGKVNVIPCPKCGK